MTAPSQFSIDDYEAIAAAVMETERGRWFLSEYARRNRAADTAAVLEALKEFERRLEGAGAERPREVPREGRLPAALENVAKRAAKLRSELESAGPPERRIERSLRHHDLLDRLIAAAFSAAGVDRKPAASTAPPAAPAEPSVAVPAEEQPSPPAAAFVEELRAIVESPERAQPERMETVIGPPSPPPHKIREAPAPSVHLNGKSAAAAPPIDAEAGGPSVHLNGKSASAVPQQTNGAGAEPVAVAVNGHVIDVTGLVSPEPVDAMSSAVDPPAAAKPVARLPSAWTPTLLEGLTEEEKAILFA